MKRREVLKYTALLTGAAISAPLATSLFSSCKPDASGTVDIYTPQFFSKDEFAIIKNLIDIILPKTDSPSATEVGVHRTIDTMVGKVYKSEDQDNYKNGLDKLIRHMSNSQASENPDYQAILKLSADKKLALLQTLDSSQEENLKDVRQAYLDLKQQTISYYLSTEEIAKNYLTYLPVPGKYEACITLEEAGGKAWAL